jgi:hypothetical protein
MGGKKSRRKSGPKHTTKNNPNRTLTPTRHKRKRNPTNRTHGLRKRTKHDKRDTPPYKEHRKVEVNVKLKDPNLQDPTTAQQSLKIPVNTTEKEKSKPTNPKFAPHKYSIQNTDVSKK